MLNQDKPGIFVSHATPDQPLIEKQLLDVLNELEFDGWYSPDRIKAAELFQRSIRVGLKECDWFLVILSESAARSQYVGAELHLALDASKRVVPIVVGDYDQTAFDLRLAPIQHIYWNRDRKKARKDLIKTLIEGEYRPTSKSNVLKNVTTCASTEILTVLRWYRGSEMHDQVMLCVNTLGEQFYGYQPRMFPTPRPSLWDLLERLKQWMTKNDYDALIEDQNRMIKGLNKAGEAIFAEVPIRIADNHPYKAVRNQAYLPVSIASSNPYEVDGRETFDFLIAYLDLIKVRSAVGSNVISSRIC